MQAAPGSDEKLAELLLPLRERPERGAVLTDVDGTIAPITERPEDAVVPERTRAVLRKLASRFALVGCVSGRRALVAREIVGLDEVAYSGNHGFELLLPGDREPRPDPSLDGHDQDVPRFVAALDQRALERVGIRTEDKGAIVALHWRGASNESEAESLAHEIASDAEWKGLVAHRGRKVLEIRPNVAINKGMAVAALAPMRPVAAAFYGGDDRTDLDAFAALRMLKDEGELEAIACVAVTSQEAPPELTASADLSVTGTEGYVEVLEELAR
jgi:trehalose 6-phosphate phosphatase